MASTNPSKTVAAPWAKLSGMPRVFGTPARSSTIAKYRMGDYSEDTAGLADFDVKEHANTLMTGIVFSAQNELTRLLPKLESTTKPGPSGVPIVSIGRMDFAKQAEIGINEQINVELNMSYLYLSMSAYFARDSVGLPGFAAHFKHASDEEREHAVRLMEFQTRRGGKVVLASLLPPSTEFEHDSKGDALQAAEIALSLEKLNFGRLRELHTLADEADDADMTHFLEDYLIDEQSRDVKEAAVLVSQLMRAGKGLGVFTIDYALQKKYDVKGAEAGLKNFGDNNGTPLFAVTPLL